MISDFPAIFDQSGGAAGAAAAPGAPPLPEDAALAGEGTAGTAPDPGRPGTAGAGAGSGGMPPEPVYLAVEDWVGDYFLPMFRRTLGGEFRWCAQWWRHGEAISRLTALWHAWEVMRLQPGTGIANWYRDHLDHQLPILMGARGPFYQCSETAHREPHEAIAAPAPKQWWDVGLAWDDSDREDGLIPSAGLDLAAGDEAAGDGQG